MSNLALEIILQELQKIAESFLKHGSPLDNIINACRRFLALQGLARIDGVIDDLNTALAVLEEHFERLKRLIKEANKDRF